MVNTEELPKISITDILQKANVSHIDNDLLMFDNLDDIPIPDRACRTDNIIIGLGLQGSSVCIANTIEHTVDEDCAIIIPHGQVIDKYQPRTGAKGICIMMSRGFFNELMKDIHDMSMLIIFSRSHPVFKLEEDERRHVVNYFNLIKEKVDDEGNMFRKDVARHLIAAMICELGNAINRILAGKENIRHTRGESIFTDFIRLVGDNYKRERRVSWYSEQMCISPKYLSETVKNISGRAPNEWIDNYVTLELRSLLRNTTKSVKEIANEMNFQNQSFLGKYFKEHVGISPVAYRNKPANA